MFLAILDLIGVAILGLIGAIAIRGVQSQAPGDRAAKFLNFLGMSQLTFQMQIALLGVFACIFLVSRTLLSMIITRRILHFLSSRSAEISSSLISKLLANENSLLTNENAVKQQFILGPGVSAVAVGILGTFATLAGDFSLFLVITTGVIVVNFEIAILSILIFGGVGFILYFKLHRRAELIGNSLARLSMEADQEIAEIIYGNREIYVRNRRFHYLERLSQQKRELAFSYAENAFLPNIGKYVLEITVILGAVLVSAWQFLRLDASHAVAGLSIFLIAGTRLAPALLRLQQGFIAIKSHIGVARPTLETLERVKNFPELPPSNEKLDIAHEGFVPRIEIRSLEFSYSFESNFNLVIPDLKIFPGETVAIVGPSGSGKSTLVDLILGLLTPEVGQVLISDLKPESAISEWPGSIGYVPQSIYISQASILENVALGFSGADIDLELATDALENAQLMDLIGDLPQGIYSNVGARGSRLSGGQRQRLGIARSLYTKPRLLILDEATSALDGLTENEVSEAINNLKSTMTVLLIAHRLSTVKIADRIIYMENGKIRSIGNFGELRASIPDFDKQAKLSGL
ncbi:MdlB ABC-type multidrug transport system, ATPase and permease components [Candidatus Nanopelagicaceae bacterium]